MNIFESLYMLSAMGSYVPKINFIVGRYSVR